MPPTTRDRILWVIVAVFGLFSMAKVTPFGRGLGPLIPAISILLPLAFALLHGTRQLGGRTMAVFFAITFGVSWCYESASIATGFPFGHYHYTEKLGPKLGTVPLLIMPAYFAMCYLSWLLGHAVLDRFDLRSDRLQRLAVPVLAAFVMVMWDMAMDPARSTQAQAWVWHDGGGYFGVPLSNFLGWYLCVWTIFQLLALWLSQAGGTGAPAADQRRVPWQQVTALYGATFLEFITAPWFATDTLLTDAAQHVWHSRDMLDTLALSAIFGMLFVTVLCAVKVQTSDRLR